MVGQAASCLSLIPTVTQPAPVDKSDRGCGAIGPRYNDRVEADGRPGIAGTDGSIADVTLSEMKGVSLFAGRTILSGRGDELVELARENVL
jgi:hypothetical protein